MWVTIILKADKQPLLFAEAPQYTWRYKEGHIKRDGLGHRLNIGPKQLVAISM